MPVGAFRTERDDGVGPGPGQQLRQLGLDFGQRHPWWTALLPELAVLEAEEDRRLDAQRTARAPGFLRAHLGQLRPGGDGGMRLCALLPIGDDGELDADATTRVGGEQRCHQRLVVGMSEDREEGAGRLRR